jgi:hypothetical protein
LGDTTVHDLPGSGQQLSEFRRRVVRRDVTVRMAQKRLAGFQRNPGTAQSPTEGMTKVVYALQNPVFDWQTCLLPRPAPRTAVQLADRLATLLSTTTRSVLVLVMDSGRMKTEVLSSGNRTL